MLKLKALVRDGIFVFLNCFVNYIPCWTIRKLFYKLFGMKIGKGTRICMKCVVLSPWKIQIGSNTMINERVVLDGRGGLRIGNSCAISMDSIIFTASHYADSDSFQYYSKPVQICSCCWIGARSVVMPGSVLEDRSIISVCSVHKGVALQNGIYAGNPTALYRMRALDTDYVQEIIDYFK